jgi:hypothetical protein
MIRKRHSFIELPGGTTGMSFLQLLTTIGKCGLIAAQESDPSCRFCQKPLLCVKSQATAVQNVAVVNVAWPKRD